MIRAVFLDRDGVINKEVQYAYKISQLRLLKNVTKAICLLNQKGFKVIIITNQAGVAKGFYKETDVELFHNELMKRLKKNGAIVDGIFYCPHHPDGIITQLKIECACRKPKTGLIKRAALDFRINLNESFLIGDKLSDIEAGKNAGCQTILVKTGYGKQQAQLKPDCLIATNLYNAVNLYIV